MKVQSMPAAIWRWWVALVRELAPVVTFFFIALMLMLVLFKLLVAQYSIEFYAFSRAAIGALIIGKAVLVMDWAESKRKVAPYPLALVVLFRTVLYGFAVIILGIADRIFHNYRETGNLHEAVHRVIVNASLDRFFGMALLITIIVGAYLSLKEINRAMGPGALRRLFLARPIAPVQALSASD